MPATITLYHVGRTPSNNQFGLAQFVEHYRSDSSAEDIYAAGSSDGVPQIGDAHPTQAAMFLTDRHISETADRGAALDLTYTGAVTIEGSSTGSLPAQRRSREEVVASATTYTSSLIWPAVATEPASLQFYAQTTTLTFFWTDLTSPTDWPDDPVTVDTDHVITWTLGGTQPASSIPGMVTWLLTNAFVQAIVKSEVTTEIVAGQYYQYTRKKTRTLLPYAPAS
jgi:hypothetical protein